MISFISENTQQTIKLGKKIGKLLNPGFIVGLYGELGSGKTTLAKGIASSFGINQNDINSASFILIRQYETKLPFYHFDLYRLDNIEQIENLGYEEYLFGEGVCIIEWAEKLNGLMPKEHIKISLSHKDKNSRAIKIVTFGKKYKDFAMKLKEKLK